MKSKNRMPQPYIYGIIVCLLLMIFPSISNADPLLFLSTQMTPVEEAAMMRRNILKGFSGEVDFQPNDNRLVFNQIATGISGAGAKPGILGGLHGDFVSLAESGTLDDIGDVLADQKIAVSSRNSPNWAAWAATGSCISPGCRRPISWPPTARP